uniref:Uncharacterized protein n=1 Tax=virus sp. ctqEG8 TaxID=2827998 RepID=A0A8S5REL7_9VIRU|nr:MAG TPA: hypothetical protein [virus sp. ctqEG8]
MVGTIRVSSKSYLVVWPCSATTPNKTSGNILIIAQPNYACKHYFQEIFLRKLLTSIRKKRIINVSEAKESEKNRNGRNRKGE